MRTSLLVCLAFVVTPAFAQEAAKPVDRWAEHMRKFDEYDKEHPPQPGGIVFVGSSSIVRWDLAKSFPEKKLLNRGFGGSQIEDSVRHLDLLVLRHKPRTVVLYAGDNDFAKGKSVEQVTADFEAFATGIRKELPKTKIVFISIKPSVARWHMAGSMQQANAAIRAYCEKNEGFAFVDVWPPMLDESGKPRPEMFVKDGLHLSPEGYAIWNKLILPHLE